MRFHCCLISAVLAFAAISARGQIFEGISSCDERYGKPVPPTDATSDVRFYQKDGVLIKILFVENKAAVITFTADHLAEERVQLTLLEANRGGSRWEEIEGAGPRTWSRADGEVFGFYDGSKTELTLMSASYLAKANDSTQVSASGK